MLVGDVDDDDVIGEGNEVVAVVVFVAQAINFCDSGLPKTSGDVDCLARCW